ncbi:MAG: glycosyltransferase [Myxococcota bacterium]
MGDYTKLAMSAGAPPRARDSSSRTVLFISRWFPPAFQIGGKRAYRFARYLPEHGWRPIVWTGFLDDGVPHDPTPVELPPEAVVDRTLIPRWWPEPKRARATGADITPGRPLQRPGPLQRLRRQVSLPVGAPVLLLPQQLRRLSTLIELYRPDAIMATASPYWTLVLGARAARRFGLPLVLDLRDPWTNNFLQGQKAGWVQRAEAATERHCLTAANSVVFTAPATTAAYQALYPSLADRFTTITNAFDPAQLPTEAAARGADRLLVHFGACDGTRRLDNVLYGLAALRDRGEVDLDELRLLNLGKPDADDLALAERIGVRMEVEPFAPLEEGLALLASADVQVLVGFGDESMFIPAKLFDYLLSGAPILALGHAAQVGAIVEGTGSGLAVTGEDPHTTAEALRRLLTGEFGPRDRRAVRAYAAPSVAETLAGVLERAVTD